MAFSADDQDPTSEQAQQERQNASLGGGSALFGSTGAPGASAAGSNPAPRSNSSGSGWINLDAYLNANSSQAQDMGNQVAGSVDKAASGAQNQINDLSNQFSNDVNSNVVNYNANDVGKDISDALNQKAGGSYDQNDVSNFQKYAGANYNGPNSLDQESGYGNASQAFGNASNKLNETQSEAGRDQLLKDQYNNSSKNGYSTGENALDQALVEGSSGAQKALSDVNQKYAGFGQALNNATSKAQNEAASARATDQSTAQQAQNALGTYATNSNGQVSGGSGALGQFSSSIYNQANQTQSAYNQAQADLQKSMANNQYTPDQLKALGLTAGEHTYGVNLSPNYVQAGTADTVANTASADQYAQAAALEQLAGMVPGGAGTTGAVPLNATDAAQAGTGAGVNGNALYSVSPAFQNDINAAKMQVPQDLVNAYEQYGQSFGAQPNAQLVNWDPTTQTATIGLGGGAAGPGQIATHATQVISLDPNSPNYVGKGNTVLGNWQGFESSPAYQQLLAKVNSTIGNAPPAMAEGGEVMKKSQPSMYASGGMAIANHNKAFHGINKLLGERVPPPEKAPKIPSMPKADNPLPKLPKMMAEGGSVIDEQAREHIKREMQKYAKGGAVLDTSARNHIASKNFALPGGRYPIEDETHARNALSRVSQFGSPEEKAEVRRKVHEKYPSIGQKMADGGDVQDDSGHDDDDKKKKTLGQTIGFPGSNPTPDPTTTPNSYARGGAVSGPKFPIHTEEHAKQSLSRLHTATPQERAVVERQVQAHYPYLMKAYGGMSGDYRSGGEVPGRAKTAPGVNSYANDTISATLSPHEIVLPRAVTQSSNAPEKAADFVRRVLAKKRAG